MASTYLLLAGLGDESLTAFQRLGNHYAEFGVELLSQLL